MKCLDLDLIPRENRESVLEDVNGDLLLDVVVLLLPVDLCVVLGLKHAPHDL